MTNRIDTVSHRMQPTHCKSMIDRVLANSMPQQLPPSHYPVLPFRQLRHDSVRPNTSPPQPAYFAG